MCTIKFSELPFSKTSGEHKGVYKIIFDNKYFYIGGSTLMRHRLSRWKGGIIHNRVHNKKIKEVIKTCSEVSFELIEEVEGNDMVMSVEDKYIKHNWGNELLLNRSPSSFSNKGIVLTNEERIEIRKRNKGRVSKHVYSDFERDMIRKRAIEMGICKKVARFDLNGNFLAEHYSISDAARFANVASKEITKIFKGKRHTCKGFIFKRIDKHGSIIENINLHKKKGVKKGFKHSYEVRLKLKELFRIRKSNGSGLIGNLPKKIGMYDTDLNLIREFESITQAAISIMATSSNICKVLKGERKTAKGYIFKYA